MGEGPHELRAQVCFVSEWTDEVWFTISLGLKSEQNPVDLVVSVMDGVTQWSFPHQGISKVSLQLSGLKRLGGLFIFGTSLSLSLSHIIQWKSADGLINYGKVE